MNDRSSTTQIASRTVPVQAGDVVTLTFIGGRGGADEAGEWEFWAAVTSDTSLTARCRAGDDPGERFRRMQTAPGYERYWVHASSCSALRPATLQEVQSWLGSHSDDAQYLAGGTISGRPLSIQKGPDGSIIAIETSGEG